MYYIRRVFGVHIFIRAKSSEAAPLATRLHDGISQGFRLQGKNDFIENI